MTRLFLIDGTALAYRSYFAFASGTRGGLTTRDGRPTGAVYGFIQTLRSLMEREKPDRVVASFDGARSDLARTKVYAEYKSTRAKMPDDLVPQLPWIERVVAAYGIPVVKSDVHEADDVIGTLAVRGRDAGMEVFIVTGDKDFMQLVGDHIKLWNLRASTRAPEILGAPEVEAKFGVRPDQIVDLLALMGDSSDNVPGVPRVGEKTGGELLAQFGSLDVLLARAEEVKKPAIRQSLLDHRDQALLSRQLVTLHTDVPLPTPVGEIPPPKPQRGELETIFRELEFDSLLASLPKDEDAPPPAVEQTYAVVRTEAELRALVAALRAARTFALATERSGGDPRHADLVGLAFSWHEGQASYVPCNASPPVLAGGRDAILAALRPVLEDEALGKAGHDTKADLVVLRRHGVELRGIATDTLLAAWCADAGQSHSLDAMALRHFGHQRVAAKELTGTGKKQKTFAELDVSVVAQHASEDADFTWRLRGLLEPELERTGVLPLYRDLELPLVPVLADMEREGIAVDKEHLARLSQTWQAKIDRIEQRVHERAGEAFNLNAPAQIGRILFEKLEVHHAAGIARPRKTKTGQFKTDATILEQLAPHHEVPELILQHRMLSKLKGTYVDSLPQMIDPGTGRIHTTFNQAVAATGRLSSDNPNLQNIPIRTEEGREVRRAFIPRAEGWVLLSADYSQIELRILAHMSGEPSLVDSFRKNEDIHARTAALVHGLLPTMVSPELRNQAKVINYGLMYGMGASRLAQETGMRPPEAKKFIEAYFKALPKVKAYLDQSLHQAQTEQCARTLFGRRRPLPEIHSTNAMQRIAAENMAVNTPIQGTAADIVKRAMLALHAALRARHVQAKLILQVHDELVLDVPEGEVEAVQRMVKTAMEGAADLAVPLAVTMNTGRTWLDAH